MLKKIFLWTIAVFIITFAVLWFFFQKEFISIGQVYKLQSQVAELHQDLKATKEVADNADTYAIALKDLEARGTLFSNLLLSEMDKVRRCDHLAKAIDVPTSMEIKEALLSSSLYSADNCFAFYPKFTKLKIKIKRHEKNGLTLLRQFGIKKPEKDLANKLLNPFFEMYPRHIPGPDISDSGE